jgi:hypothetical protein
MILHVPSKLTVLQTSSAHPRIYCLALLAIKRSRRKTGSRPEFEDMSHSTSRQLRKAKLRNWVVIMDRRKTRRFVCKHIRSAVAQFPAAEIWSDLLHGFHQRIERRD